MTDQNSQFLLNVFAENRDGRREADVSPSAQVYAEDQPTAFLKDHTMSTVWCEGTPSGVGRASTSVPWRRLFPNAPLPNGVVVRFDAATDQIILSVRKFKDWCEAKKLSATAVEMSFRVNYKVKRDRKSLAGGTGLGDGRVRVLVLDVANHSDLIALMSSQSSSTDLGAVIVGMGSVAVDTGIVTADGESKATVEAAK